MAYDPKAGARVAKVLYKPARVRQLADHLSSIEKLMNLDRLARLGPNDPRLTAGAGPEWYDRHTGKLDPLVAEAANRLDKVAKLMLDAHDELAKVDCPARDKQQLRKGLAEAAQAAKARAAAWRAPGRANARATAARIASHERASARAFVAVLPYLRKVKVG